MKLIWFIIKIGFFCFIMLLLFIVYKETTIPKPQDFDSIIVLGCQVKEDGSLSNQLKLRLEKTLEIYAKKPCLIVASGAQGNNEPISEGIAMKQWLINNSNISANDIVHEINSYSTRENLENAVQILKARNLNKPVIITSDYHMPRALAIANDLGIESQGFPSETLPEFWLNNHFREVLAWAKYLLNKFI